MSKTALIILAAVVVLIVIVVLTGMRFLRADDEDEFEGVPAGRGRSAIDDVPAGRGHARRRDDRDWPEEDGPARDARTLAGRAGHGRSVHGRAVRGPQPQRPARSARRGQDDADERAATRTRSARASDDRAERRGARDYDDRPVRQARSSREYDGTDDRGSRSPGDASDTDVRAGRDDLARRGGARGNSRPDDRRDDSAQSRRNESLPAVRPRQGRGKRDDDGEWPSTEWDELSDVDYWAELASDRPLTTTARPPASNERPGRAEPRRDADAAPVRNIGPGGTAQHEAGSKLPVRAPRQRRHADQPAVAASGGNSGEFGLPTARRASVPDSEPTLAMLASMRPESEGSRSRGPADDDPLTSPSFPRIAADDSRSYRRGRPDAQSQDAHLADDAAQTHQFGGYPAGPSGRPGAGAGGQGQRGLTPPGGYPRPAGNGLDYAAASAADPYRPAPARVSGQSGYPIPVPAADTGGYQAAGGGGYPGSATGNGGYPPAGAGSYPAAASSYPVTSADRSLAPATSPGSHAVSGSGGYPASQSGGSASYPAQASTNRYSAPVYSAPTSATDSYPAGYPAPPGANHPGQLTGQGSYPASGAGGYLDQPTLPVTAAYPADASTSGYLSPAANSYPTTSVSGAHQAPGSAGQAPADAPLSYADTPLSYTSAGAYSPQAPPLPGAPDAGFGAGYSAGPAHPAGADAYSAGQFHPAPYQPAAYPAPAHEAGGYAGTDPYALDPYGYPGYRNGGF